MKEEILKSHHLLYGLKGICLLFIASLFFSCQANRPLSTPKLADKHITFIVKDPEHKALSSINLLKEVLLAYHPFSVTVISPEELNKDESWKLVQASDILILFIGPSELNETAFERLNKRLLSGIPAIGIRSSLAPFSFQESDPLYTWNEDFGRTHFGQGKYLFSRYAGGAYINVLEEMYGHPILKGVESSFLSHAWLYLVEPLGANCRSLLTGAANEGVQEGGECFFAPHAVAWTKVSSHPSGGTTRRFYTTLGNPEDFYEASFRKLLVNAIYWGLEMEDMLPDNGALVNIPSKKYSSK